MYFFLFLLISQGVFGAEAPFPLEEPSPAISDVTQDNRFMAEFFYMLLMLSLLIGLVIFASYILRRLTSTRIETLNTTSAIKILERRSLSQRSQIYLVEIENKKFMIAENPSSLTALEVAPIKKSQYNEPIPK